MSPPTYQGGVRVLLADHGCGRGAEGGRGGVGGAGCVGGAVGVTGEDPVDRTEVAERGPIHNLLLVDARTREQSITQ